MFGTNKLGPTHFECFVHDEPEQNVGKPWEPPQPYQERTILKIMEEEKAGMISEGNFPGLTPTTAFIAGLKNRNRLVFIDEVGIDMTPGEAFRILTKECFAIEAKYKIVNVWDGTRYFYSKKYQMNTYEGIL